jgi:hypothetical protein
MLILSMFVSIVIVVIIVLTMYNRELICTLLWNWPYTPRIHKHIDDESFSIYDYVSCKRDYDKINIIRLHCDHKCE